MKRAPTTTPRMRIETIQDNFSPTDEQIETLARRLMPEIKKFFADEQVQKEFAEWKEQQRTAA